MGQEQFSGPEYYTEFDPEKFIRDMKQVAEMEKENKENKADSGEAASATED